MLLQTDRYTLGGGFSQNLDEVERIFFNIELLNELSPQNIILFRHKMVFHYPITQLK